MRFLQNTLILYAWNETFSGHHENKFNYLRSCAYKRLIDVAKQCTNETAIHFFQRFTACLIEFVPALIPTIIFFSHVAVLRFIFVELKRGNLHHFFMHFYCRFDFCLQNAIKLVSWDWVVFVYHTDLFLDLG